MIFFQVFELWKRLNIVSSQVAALRDGLLASQVAPHIEESF